MVDMKSKFGGIFFSSQNVYWLLLKGEKSHNESIFSQRKLRAMSNKYITGQIIFIITSIFEFATSKNTFTPMTTRSHFV